MVFLGCVLSEAALDADAGRLSMQAGCLYSEAQRPKSLNPTEAVAPFAEPS